MKRREIHFHITNYFNDQMKQPEFSQYWNQRATSYPSPQCLVGQILVQISTLLVVTHWRPNHTHSSA